MYLDHAILAELKKAAPGGGATPTEGLTTRRPWLPMANENPMAGGTARPMTTFDEDERDQAAVLRWVLEFHPMTTFTRCEMRLELSRGGAPGYLCSDATERALRELVGAGLLHRIGDDEMVRPTRAALRCWELTEGAS